MAERIYIRRAILQRAPTWLRRTYAGQLLGGIGQVLDDLVDRVLEGVRARFPDASKPDALAAIGRERRIRRGRGETAATYARRIGGWWDDHRGRGGPYPLLRQLYAFFRDWLNVRMDVVYYSGTRRWIDAAGVITRDAVTWGASGPEPGPSVALAVDVTPGATEIRPTSLAAFPAVGPYDVELRSGGSSETIKADGTSSTPYDRIVLQTPVAGNFPTATSTVRRPNLRWAHLWVMMYVPDTIPIGEDVLVTEDDEPLVTEDDEELIAVTSIAVTALTDLEGEIFKIIPREWSAAHIPYVTVVLLWGVARLWNYPQPVPTWTAWGASGALWRGNSPTILIAE